MGILSDDEPMAFTLTFLKIFGITLYFIGPVLLSLLMAIVILGQIIGHIESWTISDSLYFSFVTATTVGYGDFRPISRPSKFTAIIIALLGVIMTGIIVAAAINALEVAFNQNYDVEQIRENIERN